MQRFGVFFCYVAVILLLLPLSDVAFSETLSLETKTTEAGKAAFDELPAIVELLLGESCPEPDPAELYITGRWGVPENTFTLPGKADGEGMYYKDIQASFPHVNWQTLDRLYIPAGNYKFIFIRNLPQRNRCRPLIITNKGGQVKVGGYGHYYLLNLGGGRNWVVTGRYDPLSQTGDSAFPGHWGGNYANSRGTYGFLVSDVAQDGNPSGMAIGSRASDFEVEFVEVREVGFAGMTIKTDDDGSATMRNVKIHDNYIHDTISEGFYIGSTQGHKKTQHRIEKMEIFNNRIIRTGTEAIQIGQLGGDIKVYNNVFALSAIHWKDAFQNWQDGNLQLDNRTGNVNIYDNIFIGTAGNMAFFTAEVVSGDSYPSTSTIRIENNYFSSTRNHFFYVRNDHPEIPGLRYLIKENYFTHMVYQRDEIIDGGSAPTAMINVQTGEPIEFDSNIWDVSQNFSTRLANGNGVNNNVTGQGNLHQSPPALEFKNSGYPASFDWLKVEVWAENAGRASTQPHPINYEQDDRVMHLGITYRCKLDPCPAAMVPPDSPSVWENLGYPADDWRLVDNSTLGNIGLSN